MKSIFWVAAISLLASTPVALPAPATAQDWIGTRLDTDQFARLRRHNAARARANKGYCTRQVRVWSRAQQRRVWRTMRVRCHR